jgi:hypothetical protein
MDHGIKCVLTRLAYSATQYKREKQEQKGEIGLWCLTLFDNNSDRCNVYRFRAFCLDKSTVTCLLLILHNSMNFCVVDPLELDELLRF